MSRLFVTAMEVGLLKNKTKNSVLKTKPRPDFLFKYFQKVCRANVEMVLSVREGDFNPFNKAAVIAFSILFKPAMC